MSWNLIILFRRLELKKFSRCMLVWSECLLAAFLLAACSAPCSTSFSYKIRPQGYHWRQAISPATGNTVYYGINPSNGWTVYVGPDGSFYSYPGRSPGPKDLRHGWCPPAPKSTAPQPSLFSQLGIWLAQAFAHYDRLSDYTYLNRPSGYHWAAQRNKQTGAIVYYGINPRNGWTVYVGPDNIYYTFRHKGDIRPSDLHSVWDPHEATKKQKR